MEPEVGNQRYEHIEALVGLYQLMDNIVTEYTHVLRTELVMMLLSILSKLTL